MTPDITVPEAHSLSTLREVIRTYPLERDFYEGQTVNKNVWY